jgi:hypothetical protein
MNSEKERTNETFCFCLLRLRCSSFNPACSVKNAREKVVVLVLVVLVVLVLLLVLINCGETERILVVPLYTRARDQKFEMEKYFGGVMSVDVTQTST